MRGVKLRSERTIIRGGRVIDPATGFDGLADILIEGGRISKVGKKINAEGAEVFDASDKVVTPGLIDMHVHLREPGREDKETIESGTMAAAAGGFTSVAAMANTEPPTDDARAVRSIIQKSKGVSARVYPIGAVTKGLEGKEITEMADMLEAGAVAFSDDGKYVSDLQVMRHALEYSQMFDALIIVHPEMKSLTAKGQMNEGKVSSILGLKGMPRIAEEIAIIEVLKLVEEYGGRVHIAHVSTSKSVELIRSARKNGLKVTCEVTPHHFTLTDEAVRSFDTNFKMNPPLRTAEDVTALKEGLADGTIDVIATDHAPHSLEEKVAEFIYAPFGVTGLETALGLTISQLVRPEILSPIEAVARMSLNPAKILGVPGGELKVGAPADVTVVDPDLEWQVKAEDFLSKSVNSPFIGWKMKGKTIATFVDGEIKSSGEAA